MPWRPRPVRAGSAWSSRRAASATPRCGRWLATSGARCTPGRPGSTCSTRPSPPDAPLADLLGASIEHLAEGPDPVKAKVQDILGLTYDHFTQSVLLPQGRFADFLQAEPSKRQELLVELLAFGVYKKIGQQARERARLAAERVRLALEQRAKLADATAEAEERAAARVRDLEELGQAVEDRLQCPRPACRAGPPGGRGGRRRARSGRVAGGRPRAGRRGGPGGPDRRRRSAGRGPREAGRRCGQRRRGGRTGPRHAARQGSRGGAGSCIRAAAHPHCAAPGTAGWS